MSESETEDLETEINPDSIGDTAEETSVEDNSDVGAETVGEEPGPEQQDSRGDAGDEAGRDEGEDPDSSLASESDNGGRLGDPADLQKELEELRQRAAYFQTQHQKNAQVLKQYQGVDPQAVKAWKEDMQRRQVNELPAHNRYSPKYQQYQQARLKSKTIADHVRQQGGKDDEVVAALQANLPPEELKLLQEAQQHEQVVRDQLNSDPDVFNFLQSPAQFMEQAFDYFFSQKYAQMEARKEVDGWYEKHKELGDKVDQLVLEGVPWKRAVQMVENEDRLAALQGKSEELQRQSSASRERERLRKQDANLSVDAPAPAAVNINKLMKERGIQEGSAEHLRLLVEMESSNKQ